MIIFQASILLMIYIQHYLMDNILWDLHYIPYCGYCMIYVINRSRRHLGSR